MELLYSALVIWYDETIKYSNKFHEFEKEVGYFQIQRVSLNAIILKQV